MKNTFSIINKEKDMYGAIKLEKCEKLQIL